ACAIENDESTVTILPLWRISSGAAASGVPGAFEHAARTATMRTAANRPMRAMRSPSRPNCRLSPKGDERERDLVAGSTACGAAGLGLGRTVERIVCPLLAAQIAHLARDSNAFRRFGPA